MVSKEFSYQNCNVMLSVYPLPNNKFSLEIFISYFSGGSVTDANHVSPKDFDSEQDAINFGMNWAINEINSEKS